MGVGHVGEAGGACVQADWVCSGCLEGGTRAVLAPTEQLHPLEGRGRGAGCAGCGPLAGKGVLKGRTGVLLVLALLGGLGLGGVRAGPDPNRYRHPCTTRPKKGNRSAELMWHHVQSTPPGFRNHRPAPTGNAKIGGHRLRQS